MTLSTVVRGALFTVFSVVASAACSSSSTTPSTTGGTPQDPGITKGGDTPSPVAGQGTEVNPYGKPYPTKNLGYAARAGDRPGSIMRNYKFLGYRDGTPTANPVVISLADFFDPEMKTYKLIHFSAGALWCNPCNQESDELVGIVPTVKAQKITVIQALIEGDAMGTGAKLPDLNEWQSRHKVNYTLFLDPEQGNLGQFFEAASIPWNAYLDARSMELLATDLGFAKGGAQAAYTKWTAWIDANPAQAVQ